MHLPLIYLNVWCTSGLFSQIQASLRANEAAGWYQRYEVATRRAEEAERRGAAEALAEAHATTTRWRVPSDPVGCFQAADPVRSSRTPSDPVGSCQVAVPVGVVTVPKDGEGTAACLTASQPVIPLKASSCTFEMDRRHLLTSAAWPSSTAAVAAVTGPPLPGQPGQLLRTQQGGNSAPSAPYPNILPRSEASKDGFVAFCVGAGDGVPPKVVTDRDRLVVGEESGDQGAAGGSMAGFVPETLLPMYEEDADVTWAAAEMGNLPPRNADVHASDPDPVRTPPPSLESLSQPGRDKMYSGGPVAVPQMYSGVPLAVPQTAPPTCPDRPFPPVSSGKAPSSQQLPFGHLEEPQPVNPAKVDRNHDTFKSPKTGVWIYGPRLNGPRLLFRICIVASRESA